MTITHNGHEYEVLRHDEVCITAARADILTVEILRLFNVCGQVITNRMHLTKSELKQLLSMFEREELAYREQLEREVEEDFSQDWNRREMDFELGQAIERKAISA